MKKIGLKQYQDYIIYDIKRFTQNKKTGIQSNKLISNKIAQYF